jgi:hypothetical protein
MTLPCIDKRRRAKAQETMPRRAYSPSRNSLNKFPRPESELPIKNWVLDVDQPL